MMRTITATIVAMLALGVPRGALGADPTSVSPGNVRFTKIANGSFDAYSSNPTQAQKNWMRAHYWRMLVYTPYFDSRLSWFPDGWFYKDLYAIYPSSALATAHPEWILRDAAGNKLYIRYACSNGTCSQYAGDIGNPAFRANWISEAGAAMAKGYRGVMIDDVNMFMNRVSDGNAQPVAPQDPRTGAAMVEADWRRYMAEFLEQIRAAFPQKEIVHNALWFAGKADPYVQRQLRAADVIAMERGVNDSGVVKGTGTYGFETLLGVIDWLHQQGRAIWLDAEAPTDGDREYGLAAYFLVGTGTDTIGNMQGGTPGDWWSGYDVDLGDAQGPRYAWNGLFRRDFARGIVLMNQPGSSQVTVDLGGAYVDLTGASRTSVTLGAARGAVLRRPAAPPPATPPTLLDVVPLSK